MTTERSFRWIEVIGAAVASALTSAVVVSWTLSATLQELKSSAQEHERRITAVESTQQTTQSLDAYQAAQLAATDANYKNIVIMLDEIKQRLNRR